MKKKARIFFKSADFCLSKINEIRSNPLSFATICLSLALVSEMYNKRNMSFTKLTRSSLFAFIKVQDTSLFNFKSDPTRPSDERIKEAQANINFGNDVSQFISVLNKVYIIHVMPELATYPYLEAELVKTDMDLLNQ